MYSARVHKWEAVELLDDVVHIFGARVNIPQALRVVKRFTDLFELFEISHVHEHD